MSHVEQGVAERKDADHNRWAVSDDEPRHPSDLLNVLSGIVISRAEGLTGRLCGFALVNERICACVGRLLLLWAARSRSDRRSA